MRLRTKVINVDLFQKIVLAVEKIHKECIFFLTPKKIQLIVTSDVTDGIQVWSGANVALLFDEYLIESLSNGEIGFKINCSDLNRALKSALEASDVVMKLTKKGNEKLLEFQIRKMSTHHSVLTQDIPVEILTAAQLATYVEPNLQDPEVYINFPKNLRNVKNVVESMKNISDYLIISANMSGEMHLRVEASMATVTTFYQGLDHPHKEESSKPVDPRQSATVKVDIKKFSRFLVSYAVQPTDVICLFVKDRVLVLLVCLKDELHITYYIPVILTDQ